MSRHIDRLPSAAVPAISEKAVPAIPLTNCMAEVAPRGAISPRDARRARTCHIGLACCVRRQATGGGGLWRRLLVPGGTCAAARNAAEYSRRCGLLCPAIPPSAWRDRAIAVGRGGTSTALHPLQVSLYDRDRPQPLFSRFASFLHLPCSDPAASPPRSRGLVVPVPCSCRSGAACCRIRLVRGEEARSPTSTASHARRK